MKNRFIFVLRIQSSARAQARIKGGLFSFSGKGFITYITAACLYRALKKRISRASGCVRSGIGGPSFYSTYANTTQGFTLDITNKTTCTLAG